jgi:peptidylprolyl isomerase
MIEKGNTVEVHYTGRFPDETEAFDTSVGKEPLKFQIGSGQIIPGFEDALIGKAIGDKITVNIPADQAYGEVREDLFIKMPHERMPEGVQAGQELMADTGQGQPISILVEDVNDDHVLINANHPLAGRELIFDIEVINVEK